MFKNILVPIDGSEDSKHALEIAIKLAQQFESSIALIHVYSLSTSPPLDTFDIDFVTYPQSPRDLIKQLAKVMKEVRTRLVEKSKKRVEESHIPLQIILREGHPVKEIIKIAKEGVYDLIVLGSKGSSGLIETLIGSVSEKVIRHAPCNVLVTKIN